MHKTSDSLLFNKVVSPRSTEPLSGNQISLEHFFKTPERTDFKVSWSGKYLSSLRSWNGRLNLFVQKLSEERTPVGDIKQLTFISDRSINSYCWKRDNIIIYSKDFSGDENFHLYAIDLTTGNERDLTPFCDSKNEIFDTLDNVSDMEILISSNHREKTNFDIYRVNVLTGNMHMVCKNTSSFWGAHSDHNGTVRIAIMHEGKKSKLLSRNSDYEDFKSILEYSYTDSINPIEFTADNRYLYATSNIGRDKKAIVLLDPESGKEIKECFAHQSVDVEGYRFSPKRKILTAAVYTTSHQNFYFFDKESATRIGKIKSLFGNKHVSTNSANKDENLFVYILSDDKGRSFYLYDDINNKFTLLYDTAQLLPRHKLASMKPIQYVSRDGLTIHGYLTLPKYSDGKKPPLVVYPHGGPYNIRDVWNYNATVQFLANRGYAVLQVNYRGSGGYGKTFYEKSFKQWGRAMQDDITDGVLWAIQEGIADKDRIAILGGSYGGYAALAGVTFTPELYACGVDIVGPSNIFTFYDTMATYWSPVKQLWIDRIGDPIADKELLHAISPVFHVDKIKVPLLVAQGAKDPRVNVNESNQIVAALRKRGVDVEYIVKENEGHGFANAENRLELFSAIEIFFDKHLKNANRLENMRSRSSATVK